MSAIGSIATNAIDVLGGVTSATSSSGSATPASSDTTAVSGFGQFMSKLQALQSSNPAQAKQVLTASTSHVQAVGRDQAGQRPRSQSPESAGGKGYDGRADGKSVGAAAAGAGQRHE